MSYVTNEDFANGLLGTLSIMSRIIDAYNNLKNLLIANNVHKLDIPTLEAYTAKVIEKMKDGRLPEQMVFGEIDKRFLD